LSENLDNGKPQNLSALPPELSSPSALFIAETRLRVRYAETDAQGVVYHANYIVWFEVARGEYCRAAGYPYTEIEKEGYGMMVTDARVSYLSPARYDDQILLRAWMEKIGRASCIFGYQVYNETTGTINAQGLTRHAAVTPGGKVVRFSSRLYQTMAPLAGRGPSTLVLK
jgi:acyl-CoA thioester hydrolase